MTEQPSEAVVYLDSMAFILAIEGVSSIAQPVRQLFTVLLTHPRTGITSELTLAEVLAGSEIPLSPAVRRDYLDLIVSSAFLELVPISREFLCESAGLRFAHRKSHGKKLKLADAIHLITAIRRKCRYFVSADKGINPPRDIKKIAPDESGIGEILKALA